MPACGCCATIGGKPAEAGHEPTARPRVSAVASAAAVLLPAVGCALHSRLM
jgi:hypothetical protein